MFFIFVLISFISAQNPPVTQAQTNKVNPNKNNIQQNNPENSYQIDQKPKETNTLTGTFYNAKTKRYFKARYKRISSSDKTKVTYSNVPAEPFSTRSSGSKPFYRPSPVQKTQPEKDDQVMSTEDIKKIIMGTLNKKK